MPPSSPSAGHGVALVPVPRGRGSGAACGRPPTTRWLFADHMPTNVSAATITSRHHMDDRREERPSDGTIHHRSSPAGRSEAKFESAGLPGAVHDGHDTREAQTEDWNSSHRTGSVLEGRSPSPPAGRERFRHSKERDSYRRQPYSDHVARAEHDLAREFLLREEIFHYGYTFRTGSARYRGAPSVPHEARLSAQGRTKARMRCQR